jgi:FkbM family methyltransferase
MQVNKRALSFNVIETDLNIDFWIHHYQNWEPRTHDWLDKHLSNDKVFIDIGGWIGPLTLYAAQKSLSVIAFEPDPIAYKELVENINLNGLTNILAVQKAVSTKSSLSIGCETLGQSGTRESCSDNAVVVECISMREILSALDPSNISCLKIDIEGGERELLKDKTLWDLNIPMLISFHPGWFAEDRESYINDIRPFLEYKNIILNDYPDFFDLEF